MMYFPRMLDKIRLHAQRELGTDYHQNIGKAHVADGVCCQFLGVDHAAVTKRVSEGGTDEEILEWCYQNGRRPREVDLTLWNSLASKLGWRDFATSTLERAKKKYGIEHRTDIVTIPDLIDFDEERTS